MRFPTLSVRALLLLAFGGVLIAIAVSTATEWWGIAHLNRFVASVRNGDIALQETVQDMHDDVLQLRRYEKDVFINIDSLARRRGYRAKWDGAFRALRYHLVRARGAASPAASSRLQQFVTSIGEYHTAFRHTCELIESGAISTPSQANGEMTRYKDSVHQAEQQLVELERLAQLRMSELRDPWATARWLTLVSNLLILMAIGGPLVLTLRQHRYSAANP
jgi:methyl-accepting chemotaxis protein